MRFPRPPREPDGEPLFDGPSKSVRKRDAHRAQALGEQLISLKDAELAALELPEPLYDAIVAARSIGSRGGGARQRQYIGKLMRDIDLARVRAALDARAAKSAQEAQRFQRAENWRARLLSGGPDARAALHAAYPATAAAEWSRLVDAAILEQRPEPRAAPPAPCSGRCGNCSTSRARLQCLIAAGATCALPQENGSVSVGRHHHGFCVGLGDHAPGRGGAGRARHTA
jgi:ribosome-associated protein